LMARTERTEDISTLLFLVPFLASGIYGIILWAQSGISLTLPSNVYLTVTRDPYIFLVGFFAVMAGLMIDVLSEEPEKRRGRLVADQSLLQKIAAASFILAFLAAVYSSGGSVSNLALNFVVGRYSLVFPTLLVLVSYMTVTPFKPKSIESRNFLALLLFVGVPVVTYEIGKRDAPLGLGLAFALLVAGVLLITTRHSKPEEEKKSK
jgi:hypothetical protein